MLLFEYSHDPSCLVFSSNSRATNVSMKQAVASALDPIFEDMSATDCGASESWRISKISKSHAANSTLDSQESVYQIMQFIWEWQRNCNIFSNSRNSCSVYVTDELRNPPRSGRHVCISLEHRCLHHNKQRKPPDSLVILTTLTVYMWI